MALYGKYRPQNFSDMVGQESVKNTLLHAAHLGKVAHAYLFCGTRGTGKTSSARIMAKAINCTDPLPTGDPCTQCDMCMMAENNRLTDIIEIDAASNRGIDEIRDLREKVSFAPNIAKAKVYIIDEVHMMTKEAFNALLKTLEEPPAHAYFILATTEFHKVPETIRSRCQTFFFRNISIENIIGRLEYICTQEGFEYEPEGLKMIAKRASGGLRDAISLLEQSASYGPITPENLKSALGIISDEIFESFFATLLVGDDKNAFSIIEELQNQGRSLEEFAKDFLEFLRQQFHVLLQKKDSRLPWILECIEIFSTALRNIKSFSIPPLALEMAIAKAFLLRDEYKNNLQLDENLNYKITNQQEQKVQKTVQEKVQNTKKIEPKEKKREEIKAEELVKTKTENSEANNIDEKTDLTPPIPSSPYEDMDMLPPWEDEPTQKTTPQAISQKPAPIERKKTPATLEKLEPKTDKISEKNEVNTEDEAISLSKITSDWKNLCSGLPSSLKLNLIQYGTPSTITNNTLTISVESAATQQLLSSEANLKKIKDGFSSTLGIDIQVEIVGASEEEKNKKDDTLGVDDVMNLLDF